MKQGIIVEIVLARNKIMEEKKCEIHDTLLKMAKVPIHYGLLYNDEEFFEARNELFPNAITSVAGGCVFEDENEMELPVCEKCREVEAEWRKKNNRRIPKPGKIRI